MSQCVPNWELDDPPSAAAMASINPPSAADVVAATAAATNTGSRAEYEVAELTWVNGHPSMHSLGQLRIGKPVPKYPHPGSWDKALASGGTLESVVDQATGVAAAAGLIPPSPSAGQASPTAADYDLVPWIAASQHHHDHNNHRPHASSSVGGGGSSFMDALVPCANSRLVDEHTTRVPEPHGNHLGPSGSGARHGVKRGGAGAACRDGGGGNCSVSGSAASMGGGVGMSFDACDGTVGGACDGIEFTTSTSPLDGSPETENTSYGRPVTVVDEHDSPSHSRPSLQRDACEGEGKHKGGEMVRSSVSTKRSRAAAVHNQSERKRRDRINQRMKTLQKLVPNSSKTDKASMLDEVIDYVKQLQAQVQMMNRMSTAATIPHMMMPAPMQMQQLQMAAMMAQMAQMAQMGMGMGMAMGMDMAPLAAVRQPAQAPAPAAAAALPPPAPVALHHPSAAAAAAFLPAFAAAAPPSWEAAAGDRVVVPPPPTPVMPTADPFSAFMACQAQKPQMGMDAFNRMAAAMYQQIYHQQQQPQTQPQTQQQNTGANHNK